ncbi:sensor histidine kinase [Cutibacterium sp. V947]|uniref:sensor histidine kinase n=1 Tax=unclassified Cutibacterium TaxID=2649671 RepID=UPI003EE209CB
MPHLLVLAWDGWLPLCLAALLIAGLAFWAAVNSPGHRIDRAPTSSQVVSHEIRTPLSLIQGAAEILLSERPGPLNDEQRHFLQTITGNTQRVLTMTEAILLQTKLGDPNYPLSIEPFDLRALVRTTCQELREIDDASILLTDDGAPLIVEADHHLVRHVLWNLITNARRHGGTEAIRVRTFPTASGVVMEIVDEGRGMAPTDRADMFTPLVTHATDLSTHDSFTSSSPRDDAAAPPTTAEGYGLGLGIVDDIVRLHHGRIVVNTINDHGTAIAVEFPRTPSVA